MKAKELIDFINGFEKTEKSKEIPGYDARAINVTGATGIAIFTDNETVDINEKFNNVSIRTANLQFHGRSHKCVILSTEKEYISEKYGMLCLDFIDLKNRDIIQNDPLSWFKEWSTLLGNSIKKKMTYDVIGEMYCLLELYKKGNNPKWESTNAGTFDITCPDKVYEVKTSIVKSTVQVTIHNQFQLAYEELNVPLYLAFVRVEKNECGSSINDLYKELISLNYDKNKLDSYLNESGYYEGKEERYTKYLVHEIRLYRVDENFPRISLSSFKNDEIPNGVIKYEYTISLDNIPYTSW